MLRCYAQDVPLDHTHGFDRRTVTNQSIWPAEFRANTQEGLRRLAEAADWLQLHGLVATAPGEAVGAGYITSRGRAAAADPNALRLLRAGTRLESIFTPPSRPGHASSS